MHHIALELNVTETCNFTCMMCPRSTFYENRDIHMSIPVINTIISQLKSHGLINYVHISGRGEPGLFKNLSYLINQLAELKNRSMPNLVLMLSTNGSNFQKNIELYEKLDVVFINCYDETSTEDRNSFYEYKNKLEEEYFLNPDEAPHQIVISDVGEHALQLRYQKEILGDDSIEYSFGGKILNNRAGSINNNWTLKDPARTKFCHKPYKDIYLNYNGDYNLCSAVWKNIEALANIQDTPLSEWANHPNYLKYAEQKWRTLDPCKNCNMNLPENFAEDLQKQNPALIDAIKYYQRKK